MEKDRNYGLDLYRVFCCIGVLTYHVMDDVLGIGGGIAMAVYFSASYCVPGFFLLSGYLLGGREDVSLEYVEGKVFGTVRKLFGWVVFWVCVHFIRTGEVWDVWSNVTGGMAGGGIEPVAWFLTTYCFLMLAGYPLFRLMQKMGAAFAALSFAWIVLLGAGFLRNVSDSRPQIRWFHIYLGYFCLGMSLAWMAGHGVFCNKKVLVPALCAMLAFSSLVYAGKVRHADPYVTPSGYYGRWYYSIWLVSFFLLCSLIRLRWEWVKRLAQVLSENTFTVYLGHLPILLYATSIAPLGSTGMALFVIFALFVGLEGASIVFRRLPLLRKLT